jgi:hypothetical protein
LLLRHSQCQTNLPTIGKLFERALARDEQLGLLGEWSVDIDCLLIHPTRPLHSRCYLELVSTSNIRRPTNSSFLLFSVSLDPIAEATNPISAVAHPIPPRRAMLRTTSDSSYVSVDRIIEVSFAPDPRPCFASNSDVFKGEIRPPERHLSPFPPVFVLPLFAEKQLK